jgi:hypothetical protein
MPEVVPNEQHVDFLFKILKDEHAPLDPLPDRDDREKSHVTAGIHRFLRSMLVDQLGVTPAAADAAFIEASNQIYAGRLLCTTYEGEFND